MSAAFSSYAGIAVTEIAAVQTEPSCDWGVVGERFAKRRRVNVPFVAATGFSGVRGSVVAGEPPDVDATKDPMDPP